MAQFTVSRKANRDLTDIWKYIAEDSIQYADRWIPRMFEVFAVLGAEPRLGVTSDQIRPGTRRFPVGNYLIYYRAKGNRVQIVRVFHGKRDQRKAFRQ